MDIGTLEGVLIKDPTIEVRLVAVDHFNSFVGNGTMGIAHLEPVADAGIVAELAQKEVSGVSSISHPLTTTQVPEILPITSSARNICTDLSILWGSPTWTPGDFIEAHTKVVNSGVHNFQVCKIPIPTPIRYDRIRDALGEKITPKEHRVLELLQFGMPLDCKEEFGIKEQQRNHHSAVSFPIAIQDYFDKNLEMQAILGPFKEAPIPNLRYSPLMTVPKEETKRRVIIDFSFPAGRSINDGIPKATYLDFKVEFCLPSVQAMIARINFLGKGCHLYKKDLKHAFRQFSIDPGDYEYTGIIWNGNIYIDTRLAMGLRSSAYCCQSVTQIVANIASERAHTLVYFDDFGGAELPGKADEAFNHLGYLLEHFGLEESPEKAVSPTTCMDWLGIRLDTVEWTMALKPNKLKELLTSLPSLLKTNRVKKVDLQKVLGSLVWATAVVRAGIIFFNRLLGLLRKLKRPHHSIHFSVEAKKDVYWWLRTLRESEGKCSIPPSVWTPLTSFSTDASLDGFGMVWGKRALAGNFTHEFDSLDISKKEMVTVMVAIKHWFQDLANSKVKIYIDNQACVALINYGITKAPFLASCLREIQFYLAKFNVEIVAEYIPSKQNHLADLCSRAYTNETYFRNFNALLNNGTLVLENIYYNKFNFEHEL